MIIIPAVDIKDGKCVRLVQGRMDEATVYADDPAAMALMWVQAGAKLIHVVDLDGAFARSPRNIDAIRKILGRVDVPVQLGGGIRNQATIEMFLDMGAARVIIGSGAVQDPKFVRETCRRFPNRIVLGIDARKGRVAIDGWSQTTEIKAVELAKEFENCGLAAINFTDIHRDGMQTGPNIEEIQSLAESIATPVVASGGVSTLEDIRNLLRLEAIGVVGIIIGKALYSGALDFKKALKLVSNQ